MPRSEVRRSQAERSAATRSRLVEAAIASLIERGWAATTSVEVCAQAGVTRGAFVHHFPSLPALMAAALQSVYDETADRAPPPPTDLVGLVDATWHAIDTPRFKAVLEAWLAMANDPRLAGEIGPVVQRFAALVSPGRVAPSVLDDAERHTYYLLARETMLGLALGRATNGGAPLGHERPVLDALRAGAVRLDRSGTRRART
jgi:AcrR family transcriptional regulator